LHAAAKLNHLDAVKVLLAAGSTIQLADALINAVSFPDRVALVRKLLEEGAPSNSYTTGSGDTALHFAASKGNFDACKLLVEFGAKLNTLTAAGKSAVELASENSHKEVVDFLISKGATKPPLGFWAKCFVNWLFLTIFGSICLHFLNGSVNDPVTAIFVFSVPLAIVYAIIRFYYF